MSLEYLSGNALCTVGQYTATESVDLETYSIWAYQTANNETQPRLFDDNIQRSVHFDTLNSDKLRLVGRRRPTPGRWNWVSISANTWHCIQVTFDNTDTANKPSLYVDGVNQDVSRTEENAPSGSLDSGGQAVRIGNSSGQTRGFEGRLAEAALWDQILTEDELDSVRLKGPLAVPSGLILYVPLRGLGTTEPNLAPAAGALNGTVIGDTFAVADHPPVGPYVGLDSSKTAEAAAAAARRVISIS